MNVRSTETTVTFAHPFRLDSLDRQQPAGTYLVITDEEEIANLSFTAYQRVATLLQVPALSAPNGTRQVFTIDPAELAVALAADERGIS